MCQTRPFPSLHTVFLISFSKDVLIGLFLWADPHFSFIHVALSIGPVMLL